MKRLLVVFLLVVVTMNVAAQVGASGYSADTESLLVGHLERIQARSRTTRMVTAGLDAALAATTIVFGSMMLAQADGDAFQRMNGYVVIAGGVVLGAGSAVLFARPSVAERDTAFFFSLPTGTESERIDRFVIGESILRNLRQWSITSRMTYGVLTGALAANFFLSSGWISGGVLSAAAIGFVAIPGLPEREWRAYVRETQSAP